MIEVFSLPLSCGLGGSERIDYAQVGLKKGCMKKIKEEELDLFCL